MEEEGSGATEKEEIVPAIGTCGGGACRVVLRGHGQEIRQCLLDLDRIDRSSARRQ
jgi:hypothetical protein